MNKITWVKKRVEKNKDFLVENMQEICFVNSWLNNARSSHQIVKDIDFFFFFFGLSDIG